jgi:hypothetical protein
MSASADERDHLEAVAGGEWSSTVLRPRDNVAIAFHRDAAIREPERTDQVGNRRSRDDAPSFPVHDDLEGGRHGRQTIM